MSFILDALRKSEHERQRQSGPGVADWRAVTAARSTFPIWAMAIASLLAVNLIVVLIFSLRGSFSEPASVAAAPAGATSPSPIQSSASIVPPVPPPAAAATPAP